MPRSCLWPEATFPAVLPVQILIQHSDISAFSREISVLLQTRYIEFCSVLGVFQVSQQDGPPSNPDRAHLPQHGAETNAQRADATTELQNVQFAGDVASHALTQFFLEFEKFSSLIVEIQSSPTKMVMDISIDAQFRPYRHDESAVMLVVGDAA
ncbi:hypothetical protein JDV02_009072 [Purpureocillium takamizusanense]|uniref:Uncharacterized protein n=1 Tax=Purpureocillium takamizusanense TaxID=2060973 RepID=A0A9Q8VFT3_9HYPO|nr:uncharacterized protein JDV02_009072 [Purpureocillium takamizusanense]UNI23239.1 hypothetical protein JDV02_009072 [Purpureocillium takamizusanense]